MFPKVVRLRVEVRTALFLIKKKWNSNDKSKYRIEEKLFDMFFVKAETNIKKLLVMVE